MATERIPVEGRVLVWARESVGLVSEAAAKKLGISAETLSAWEEGHTHPTIKQLRKAAKVYRRPLAVLFLSTPPRDFDAMRDFRREPGDGQRGWSYELHTEFRRALAQREIAIEIADADPDLLPAGPLPPPLRLRDDPEMAGADLREHLGIDWEQQRRFADANTSLNRWVAAAESRGVLVIQTSSIDTKEMRGFSVSEQPFPVVALNGSDPPRARSFTLLHELAHIAINEGGLCDLDEPQQQRARQSLDLERWCNRVAASVLMPRSLVFEAAHQLKDSLRQVELRELEQIADDFKVSREALLLRLVSLELADWETYDRLKPQIDAAVAEARARERERRSQATGGPSYYVVKVRDLGRQFARTVLSAYESGLITGADASSYLGVKYGNMQRLGKALR